MAKGKARSRRQTADTVEEYLNNIDETTSLTGSWKPQAQWNAVHGDGKSTTNGTFSIAIMHDSQGRYIAKVNGAGQENVVVDEKDEPTLERVIKKLKEHYLK